MREELVINSFIHFGRIFLIGSLFFLGCGGGGGYSSGGGMASNGCPSGTTILVAPVAPTNVTGASGPAVNEVKVSWFPVNGATSYNLYMASVTGVTKSNYSTLPGGMLHLNVCSPYIHAPTLTSGTTYYFVVTAVNVYGESPDSIEVSAKAL